MRKYNFYKHENLTDLVIEPIRCIWLKNPERLIVKALLYTDGYPGKRIYMDKCEWTILKEDYGKWHLIDKLNK